MTRSICLISSTNSSARSVLFVVKSHPHEGKLRRSDLKDAPTELGSYPHNIILQTGRSYGAWPSGQFRHFTWSKTAPFLLLPE